MLLLLAATSNDDHTTWVTGYMSANVRLDDTCTFPFTLLIHDLATTSTMRSLALLVAAFTLLSAALAHRMELNGNSQCFHETLNEKDMVRVTTTRRRSRAQPC
jgi:hypothetical protein